MILHIIIAQWGEHLDCQWGRHFSCAWLFWCSVATARWQRFKEKVAWMWGIQSDFLSSFSNFRCIQFLEGVQGSTNNPFSCQNRSLSSDVWFL